MKTKKDLTRALLSTLTLGVAMGLGGAETLAAPISCNTADAMANGSYADQCVGDDNIIPPSDAGELTFINGSFTTVATTDDFFLADKSDGGATNGFLLTITEDPTPDAPDTYLFRYTLAVPDEYVGLTADWVLAVKQASDSYIVSRVASNSFTLKTGMVGW